MWKKIAKYAAVTLLIIVCCFGELYHMRPFGYGVWLAGLLFLNPLALTFAVVGGELAAAPGLATVIELACTVAAVGLTVVLLRRKKLRLWHLLIAAAVGKIGCAYRVVAGESAVLTELLSLGFEALIALVAYTALKPLLVDALKYRLLEAETASLAMLGLVVGLSLSALELFGFNPAVTVGVAFVVLAAAVSGAGAAFAAAVAMGAGASLYAFDASLLAALAVAAAFAALFAAAPRMLTAAAAMLGFIMATYLFGDGNGAMAVAAAASGALLAMCLPPCAVKYLKNTLGEGQRPALRYMINRTRSDMGGRLTETGRIFGDMGQVMCAESAPLKSDLGRTLRARVCADCRDCKHCSVTDAAADELMRTAVANGHAGISALPPSVADGCSHLAAVIKESDRLVAEHAALETARRREGEIRMTVAEHLFGIRDVLDEMGRREAQPVGMHPELERKLTEELTYRNVVCGESLIAEVGEDTKITLVVRLDCIDKQTIEQTVSKVLKARFSVTGVSDSNLSGWGIVYLENSPRLDALFAAASVAKDGSIVSGDTHSFIKIGSRFMMALSDGMGSGEQARTLSENAITLVESFYKAGYPYELILKSVNRFLSYGSDGFSAVDITVIDLNEGRSDLIKIGAPPSYIKNADTVSIVRGEALPLGMVEEMRPYIVSRVMHGDEVAVLVSDGVADCFEGDGLADFINKLPPYNPQALCSAVLEKALSLSGGRARDDMTVLATRVFERV